MLPTYDIARLRIEDWLREADHDRLVQEAKAARNASHPERSGVLAAVRGAGAVPSRSVPWRHEPPSANELCEQVSANRVVSATGERA
jgi:hypothetical protein